MSKRFVVCFDGTWNMPREDERFEARLRVIANRALGWLTGPDGLFAKDTNVEKISKAIASTGSDGLTQMVYYDRGVGTNWYDALAGGVAGIGLSRNIRQGYHYLARNYDEGDEIFIFGFSRGAYTARSLAGMISRCGLLPKREVSHIEADRNPALLETYLVYRGRGTYLDRGVAQGLLKSLGARDAPIKMLGVWDTVGALGIPVPQLDDFNKALYEFHDTELSDKVYNAFHALAVDEHRQPFAPTLWDAEIKPWQRMEQRWFIGSHCDVGGGNPSSLLSNITLKWMMDNAKALGLTFNAAPTINENDYLSPFRDSYNELLGIFTWLGERSYRTIGGTRSGREVVDNTVINRLDRDPEYQPKNPGLKPGLS
ncbi:MAG: DUF2235 domain-containing protein [Hyphomicrobiaceae bacterium]